jgi:hypothetical protein
MPYEPPATTSWPPQQSQPSLGNLSIRANMAAPDDAVAPFSVMSDVRRAIVGVGSSAGGLAAMQEFVMHLEPEDLGTQFSRLARHMARTNCCWCRGAPRAANGLASSCGRPASI